MYFSQHGGIFLSNQITSEYKHRACHQAILPWLICLSAGLFFFYEFFQLNIFDVINHSLRESFNISAIELSWMSSSFIWANVLFLLPAGVIIDHFAVNKVIFIALLICILGTLGFGLTNSFPLATFFHSLTGLGNAFCFLSCVVLVSRWFPPNRQALVIGCIVTMAFLGGMAAHTPFSYLNTQFGWRQAILIDAALGAVILMWILYIVRDKKMPLVVGKSQQSWLHSCRIAIRNKQTWLAGLYTSCLNLPIMVLCALWGSSYLATVHKLNPIDASNIISLIFIGSIFGGPLVGLLSDLHGRRKPLMLFGAATSFLLVSPLIFGGILSKLTLSFIFFFLGVVSSTQIISYPLIAESNDKSNTGIATGIASVIIMSGGGVAQVLFGKIMQNTTGNVAMQYSVDSFKQAMLIFPITALIAIIATLFIRETYCKQYNMYD